MAVTTSDKCKKIRISSKREITIPATFFNAIGFGNEAECIYTGNELILRPVCSERSEMFSKQILDDLIREGYSGESMLSEFKTCQTKVNQAVGQMLKTADAVAEGKDEYMTMSDIF